MMSCYVSITTKISYFPFSLFFNFSIIYFLDTHLPIKLTFIVAILHVVW